MPLNELKLADLGEGMHEAEIVEWLVKEGENVRLDQPVVRVETDKALVEIPSPLAGRVSKLCFQAGQTARVGDVLLTYELSHSSNGHGSATEKQSAPRSTRSTPPTPPTSSTPPATNGAHEKQRVLAAPAVRKLAYELEIDLTQVPPSVSGRVTIEDVRAYAAQASHPPASSAQNAPSANSSLATPPTSGAPTSIHDERQPLTGLRKRIAEHMERSWRTVPHATAFDEFDASQLVALRQALLPAAEKRGLHLTYMPLLTRLLIPALKQFPIFNASLDEEKREIIYKRSYHLGIATASPEGLLVPVLRDADRLSIGEITRRLDVLIEGAKKRTLAPHELSGSTFTLNNVGSFGGSSGTPIINYPEVAILAVGRIEEKAIVRHGTIIAQLRLPLALSFDHRLIDGALAGAFLGYLKELVEQPQQLLLDMI